MVATNVYVYRYIDNAASSFHYAYAHEPAFLTLLPPTFIPFVHFLLTLTHSSHPHSTVHHSTIASTKLLPCSSSFSEHSTQVRDATVLEIPNDRTDTYIRAIRDRITSDLQLVVVIFPTSRDDRYSSVKKLCCIEHPVPSQVTCITHCTNTHTYRHACTYTLHLSSPLMVFLPYTLLCQIP